MSANATSIAKPRQSGFDEPKEQSVLPARRQSWAAIDAAGDVIALMCDSAGDDEIRQFRDDYPKCTVELMDRNDACEALRRAFEERYPSLPLRTGGVDGR